MTDETRAPDRRRHRALPLDDDSARAVLSDATRRLWPLLSRVLQAEARAPLIGSGFMRVAPGAAAQPLHKDVHGFDRHEAVADPPSSLPRGGAARAVSVQLQLTDTTAGAREPMMGSLELLPGSHRPDAANGRADAIEAAAAGGDAPRAVPVAVPRGSVTVYSSRVWHRGGANRSERERTFCFLTVAEPDSPAPPGLIHTMALGDVGRWEVGREGIARNLAGGRAGEFRP